MVKLKIEIYFINQIKGNLVALASIDPSQIESMKQPFIDSLFNLLEAYRQRQISNDQSGKSNQMTSLWHPIVGHVKGKTSTMTM